MSLLAKWFPISCSRLRIFICYARDDRKLAEEIAQALTNDGHDVFIDINKFDVSDDFNEKIRRAIAAADRFIFLISKASIGQGKYPQTELGFAKDRWPSPQGVVWPVLADPDFDLAQLPVYLRSVQIHYVRGNAPAEIAAAMEKTRLLRPRCLLSAAIALALLTGGAGFVATGGLERMKEPSFTLLAPQQVDFRPARKPDPDPAWTQSRLAVTLIPVQYANEGGKPVRIVEETVTVPIRERAISFKWYNEVEIQSNCGTNYLCTKNSVGTDTLKPNSTLRRETMFMPASGETVSWQDFLDAICASKGDTLDVTITGEGRASSAFGSTSHSRTALCRIDLITLRGNLEELGCKTGLTRIPRRLSPECTNS